MPDSVGIPTFTVPPLVFSVSAHASCSTGAEHGAEGFQAHGRVAEGGAGNDGLWPALQAGGAPPTGGERLAAGLGALRAEAGCGVLKAEWRADGFAAGAGAGAGCIRQ